MCSLPSGAPTIVVVDDDTTWLSDLQTWLARDGFTVIGISRGEWVIEAVEWHRPYAVIVDLQLPDMDGLEILRQVRRRRPQIPVVVMTAFGGPDVQDRVRRLGRRAIWTSHSASRASSRRFGPFAAPAAPSRWTPSCKVLRLLRPIDRRMLSLLS